MTFRRMTLLLLLAAAFTATTLQLAGGYAVFTDTQYINGDVGAAPSFGATDTPVAPTDTPSPTDTPAPATDTPVAATDTPSPTDTPSATDTPGPDGTATPTPTEDATETPGPTETATSTPEPPATPTVCPGDVDCDGYLDPPATLHEGPANTSTAVDNCPADYNPDQLNADGNFIDQSSVPPYPNDLTWVNSDGLGDACDPDDDNDGLADANEPAGCNGSGPLSPLLRDTDGDLVLDNAECVMGSNPGNAASKPVIPSAALDPDRDRLSTAFEGTLGTNPNDSDSDDDGLRDGLEYKHYNSDSLAANTDGDLCGDAAEVSSLNGDSTVNSADQLIFAMEYFRIPPPPIIANIDLNKDGVVNSGDQLILATTLGAGDCT